jgi:hypothetical protein
MADTNTTANATQAANSAAPQGNAAEGSTNLTLAHLNLLSSAVLVAQKRGTFSLEESAALVEPVKLVAELIKKNNQQNQSADATAPAPAPVASDDNNTANAATQSTNDDPKLVVEQAN